jgi:hypothetical protein
VEPKRISTTGERAHRIEDVTSLMTEMFALSYPSHVEMTVGTRADIDASLRVTMMMMT